MHNFITIIKALSDRNRLRALIALDSGELCVCQLIELLQLAPSTVSKHLSILRQARLVEGTKRGRWMYYKLPEEEAAPVINEALLWVRRSLQDDRAINRDQQKLQSIRQLDLDLICKHQKTKNTS